MRRVMLAMASVAALAGCGGSTTTVTVTSTGATSATSTAAAQTPQSQGAVSSAAISTAEPSVVLVGCPGEGSLSSGSGFKDSAGYVVTAAHVIRACSQGAAQVEVGDETGGISQFDPTHDLALIDSKSSNLGPLLSLATRPARVGEPVAMLGFPGGSGELVVSRGTVVAVGRTITTTQAGYSETLTDAIQVRGSTQPGDSGGPAINSNGEVVGIVEIDGPDGQTVYLTPASDVAGEPTPP